MGEDPVTWDEVLALNEYGFQVTSAAVLRDPAPTRRSPPSSARGSATRPHRRLMVTLGAVMLLVVTALLVGPAFAVSAARQRRTLALAASNGASTAVLRRTVLAQALVLGTASALFGVALGVAAARAVVGWTRRDGLGIDGPFDVRWELLAALALCATVSTLVAGSPPPAGSAGSTSWGSCAGRASRRDPHPAVRRRPRAGGGRIGGDLRRHRRRSHHGPRPRRRVPRDDRCSAAHPRRTLPRPGAADARRQGGHRLPASLRMAARDLARHRSRSAPSVAASRRRRRPDLRAHRSGQRHGPDRARVPAADHHRGGPRVGRHRPRPRGGARRRPTGPRGLPGTHGRHR